MIISVSEGADANVDEEALLLELELNEGADSDEDPETTVLLRDTPETEALAFEDARGVDTLLVWLVLGRGSGIVTGGW